LLTINDKAVLFAADRADATLIAIMSRF
jgi:hypothetical protein